jgi:hypothetical protein
LFNNDWRNYRSAIIDTQTPNRSFVRIANLYKEMGIRNNSFMLALFNPELQGVDPFSSKLTMEQMASIAIECKSNPFYYFREIVKAPAIAGGQSIQFEANRGNMALYWLFFNHITTILIQIRQTGKSFSVDALMTLLLNIVCSNTSINLLTKDDILRAANITRLKEIDSELPFYLRQRTKNDVNNTEELTVRSLGNSYRAHVPQKSPKMALNLGRGLTSPIFHIDEGPFQPNIGISLPSALSAGTAARDMARRNDEPYGTILTTTAGKKDDRDGKFVYELLMNSAEWTERLLDAENALELEKMIRKNSRSGELRVNCTFSHRQLGKSDEWLKQAIEDAMVSGEAADRDFFNVWTSGTQSSPLPIDVLEKIRASQEQEQYVSISNPHGYMTKWYIAENDIEYRMANGNYVLSSDSSDASGGDDISLFLTDIRTAETIAAGNYNETNLITFAEWLCSWFVKYPTITGIIERRSSGAMILDYLILMLPAHGIDPFKRLFNRAVNDADEYTDRWKEISTPMGRRRGDTLTVHKKTFGFSTSGTGLTSRTDLYSTTLQNAAKRSADKIKDLTTINQITGLTTRNGRVDHQVGEHDDMVIAWLLNFWLLTQGKNLSHYGIDSKAIFSEIKKIEILDNRSRYEFQEQQNIRFEIENIFEKIKNESDDYIVQRLEFQLRNLNRRLVLEEGEIFSLDDLINSVREQRKQKRYSGSRETSGHFSNYDNNAVASVSFSNGERYRR